jgi:hypothetical protein
MFSTIRKPWRPVFVAVVGLSAVAAIAAPARAQVLFGPYPAYGPGGALFPLAGNFDQSYQAAAYPMNGLAGGLPASRYAPRPMVSGRFLDRGLIETTPAGGGTLGSTLTYSQRRIDELIDQPDSIMRNGDMRLVELRDQKDRLYIEATRERDPKVRAAKFKEYEELNRQYARLLGSTGRSGTATARRGTGPTAGGAASKRDRYGSPGWFARHPIPLTREAAGYPPPQDPPPAEYVPPTATARAAPARPAPSATNPTRSASAR